MKQTAIDFYLQKLKEGWKVGFDWLIKNDENILKVVEGNYQDKQQKD